MPRPPARAPASAPVHRLFRPLASPARRGGEAPPRRRREEKRPSAARGEAPPRAAAFDTLRPPRLTRCARPGHAGEFRCDEASAEIGIAVAPSLGALSLTITTARVTAADPGSELSFKVILVCARRKGAPGGGGQQSAGEIRHQCIHLNIDFIILIALKGRLMQQNCGRRDDLQNVA